MFRDSVIILVITAVLLVIVEFSLRLVFPEKEEKEIDLTVLAYEHDANTIISLKPNITKEFKNNDLNGGEVITWQTNSLGYRGEEIAEKEGYRIVVYGDSNVQARFSRLDNTFTKKLEQSLKNKISKVEVINGGLVGAGPDQSLLRFINEENDLKPDMVILHIFADNDYGDIVRNRLFEIDANGQLSKTSYEIKRDQQISQQESSIISYLNSLLITRAMLKLVAQDESNLSRDEKVDTTIKKLEIQSELEFLNYKNGAERSVSHFADHYDFDLATNPEGEAARAKVLLMYKILEKAKFEAGRKNIKLLIVVQPSVFDVLTENTTLSRNDLSRYEKYDYKNLTDPVNGICKSLGLHCVNLIDDFLNNNSEQLYLKEDNHWSDKGQALSARVTSQYILNNMLQ